MYSKARSIVENYKFNIFIILVIIFNAVILGVDTMKLAQDVQLIVGILDDVCLYIFMVELALKIYVYRFDFFKNGWNIFDFIIVGLSLFPSGGNLAIFRAFRIIRVLRLLSAIPKMKMVASALINSLSGMFGVGVLLAIFFYIYAVIATKLFGESFVEYFGNMGKSLYSLFQIMTLESWSNGIVRPILKIYPYAWIVFVTFILIVSFVVLNMAIGIVVDSISEVQEEENTKSQDNKMSENFKKLQDDITEIKSLLSKL